MSTLALLSLAFGCAPTPDSSDRDLLEPLQGPCHRHAVTSLLLEDDGLGWVGCGGGGGVHRTRDAGASFEAMHASERLEVRHLAWDASARPLVCGRDASSPGPDRLLLRYAGDQQGWQRLLSKGDAGLEGPCGRVAAASDGALTVTSVAQPGLAHRAPDAERWHPSKGAPILYDMVEVQGAIHAVGADLVSPPVFLAPLWRSRSLGLASTTVDPELDGELWTLATPDDGQTWFVGGRELLGDAELEAVLYRSKDAGRSWQAIWLPPGLGWVRDLAFSPDGHCGVAVGHAQRDDRGFVLIRGELGWHELDTELPPLRTVDILDGGFVVGGEDGTLARGLCS